MEKRTGSDENEKPVEKQQQVQLMTAKKKQENAGKKERKMSL